MLVNTQNFSARRFGPSLSGIAMSAPVIWSVTVRSCNVRPPVIVHLCQVLHFSRPAKFTHHRLVAITAHCGLLPGKKYGEKNTTPRIDMNIYGVLTIALIGEMQGVDAEMQGVDTLHARRGRPQIDNVLLLHAILKA